MFPAFSDFLNDFLESNESDIENKSENIEYLETQDYYLLKLKTNQGSKKDAFRILSIEKTEKSKEVPDVIYFALTDKDEELGDTTGKYGIEEGDEIVVKNLIGGLIYKNFYQSYRKYENKKTLRYILSRVYENYYIWKINKDFTNSDLSVYRELKKIMDQPIITVDDESDTVRFPIIDKTEKIKRLDKNNNQLFGFSLSVQLLTELKDKTNDKIKSYIFTDDSEPVFEDIENDNKHGKVTWKQKEINIQNSLNEIFEKRSVSCQAIRVGGDTASDISVRIGDNNGFFVEVKNDYESAHYLKFSMTYDGTTLSLKDSQVGSNKEFSRTEEYEKEFNDIMKSIITDDKTVKKSFEQLGKNVLACINDMEKIKSVSEKIKFDKIKAVKFPEGFIELAKVFNFYIQEWIKRYMVLKSEMIYRISTNKNVKQLENLQNEIEKIDNKISRILVKTKRKDITQINQFDKFKYMYQMFISGDRTNPQTPMSIDNQEYNYRLFTFDSSYNSSERQGITGKIIENIIKYYRDIKKCAYIEVENDVYRLFNTYSDLKDIWKNVEYFENKVLTQEFSGDILDLSKFMECGVNVCVAVKNGTRLKLEILFSRPKTLNSNGVSFEDIAKKLKKIHVVNNRNAR